MERDRGAAEKQEGMSRLTRKRAREEWPDARFPNRWLQSIRAGRPVQPGSPLGDEPPRRRLAAAGRPLFDCEQSRRKICYNKWSQEIDGLA